MQSDQITSACQTTSCAALVDQNADTCIQVPVARYPFGVKAFMVIYHPPVENAIMSVNVTGYGLSCMTRNVLVGYRADDYDVYNWARKYNMCPVTTTMINANTQQITCIFSCQVQSVVPRVLYVDASSEGLQLCHVMLPWSY